MPTDFLPASPRQRADAATLVSLFVLALCVVPARAVIRGVPLSISPATLIGLGVFLCWFCAHFTTTLGMAKGRSTVRSALFGYIVVLMFGFGCATYAYLPSDELNMADHTMVTVLAVIGIALCVCDGVRGRDRLDFVLKSVVVGASIVATIGALQFIFGLDLTKYLLLPGLRSTSDDLAVLDRETLRRVASTTGHPIEFGVVCAMVLPLALHYGFQARERAKPFWRWWLCSALLAAGMMFSVSRSAILGIGAAGLLLLVGWKGRRRLWALLVTVVFLGVMKVLVPGLLGTFYGLFANSSTDSSVSYRTHRYTWFSEEFAKHPWVGRGIGTWYVPKHFAFDNQYLMTLVENGIIGLVAFAAVFLAALYTAVRTLLSAADPDLRDLALSLCAAIVVPVLGTATFDLLSFATVTGCTFVLVGAAGVLLRTNRELQLVEGASHPGAAGAESRLVHV